MYALLLKNPYETSSVYAASEDKDKLIELAENEDLDVDIWFGSEQIFSGCSGSDSYFDIEKLKVI